MEMGAQQRKDHLRQPKGFEMNAACDLTHNEPEMKREFRAFVAVIGQLSILEFHANGASPVFAVCSSNQNN